MRLRAWIKLMLAVLAAVAGIVTAVYPTWFEALSEASPDEGSGTFEFAVAIALIATSVVLSLLTGRDFRRVRALGMEA